MNNLFDDIHDPNFRDYGEEAIKDLATEYSESMLAYKESLKAERHDHFPKFCRELSKRTTPRTPDWKNLLLHDHHIVFVYGRLRIGEVAGKILSSFPYLGEGKTVVEYVVKNSVSESYPLIFPTKTRIGEACHIYGDLFIVPPEVILELDHVLNNEELVERKKIFCWAKDQKIGTDSMRPSVGAWAYLGHSEHWRGVYLGTPKGISTITTSGKTYKLFDIRSK